MRFELEIESTRQEIDTLFLTPTMLSSLGKTGLSSMKQALKKLDGTLTVLLEIMEYLGVAPPSTNDEMKEAIGGCTFIFLGSVVISTPDWTTSLFSKSSPTTENGTPGTSSREST